MQRQRLVALRWLLFIALMVVASIYMLSIFLADSSFTYRISDWTKDGQSDVSSDKSDMDRKLGGQAYDDQNPSHSIPDPHAVLTQPPVQLPDHITKTRVQTSVITKFATVTQTLSLQETVTATAAKDATCQLPSSASDAIYSPFNDLDAIYQPPQPRVNATILILTRNEDLKALLHTIRHFEDRFNLQHQYPYTILNDKPFSPQFIAIVEDYVRSMTARRFGQAVATARVIEFDTIPEKMWSTPAWIDQVRATQAMRSMEMRNIIYGGSESYRHMCRFNSGFFYDHPLVQKYRYYWRLEPGVTFYCDLDYDPFLFMQENGKMYGFNIALEEIYETVASLWDVTIDFARKRGMTTWLYNYFRFGQEIDYADDDFASYNLCHFWSNFEIADMNLWRSQEYRDYFDYLDKKGGFYYERWGDAPVHSLAVGLFLNKSQVHYFKDIGYRHESFKHCDENASPPEGARVPPSGVKPMCMCPPSEGGSSEGGTDMTTDRFGKCIGQWSRFQDREWDMRNEYPYEKDSEPSEPPPVQEMESFRNVKQDADVARLAEEARKLAQGVRGTEL